MDAAASISPPDWDAISHEVICPLCEYNLRGLADPRCPECGYRFAWHEVMDPKTRAHPYLFEHHPEKNIRSFFRTLWGSLRPVRFWKSLSPAQPSRRGRLLLYWALSTLLAGMVVPAAWARAIVDNWNWYLSGNAGFATGGFYYYSPSAPRTVTFSWPHLWATARWSWRHNDIVDASVILFIVWAAWPWLSLFALSIFQISMERAKVRTVHVVRCLVYSLDIGAWIGLLAAALIVLSIWLPAVGALLVDGWPLALLAAVVVVRLWAAYRWYLRFKHPFWTIVLAQVVTILLAAVCAQVVGQIVDALRR